MAYIISSIKKSTLTKEDVKEEIDDAITSFNQLTTSWFRDNGGWMRLVDELNIECQYDIDHIISERKKYLKNREDTDLFENIQDRWMIRLKNKLPQMRKAEIMTFALMLLIIVLRLPITDALTAYDCSKLQVGEKKYSLLDTEMCPEAQPMKIKKSKPIVYNVYQESDFIRTMAKECIVKKSITAWNCGHQSWSSIIVLTTPFQSISISKQNCEDAFQIGSIRIEQGITVTAKKGMIINERINRISRISVNGACYDEGVWMYAKVKYSSAIVVEDYQVELREYLVTFDENGKMVDRPYCLANAVQCSTGQSILIYRPPPQECRMAFLKSVPFYELDGFIYRENEINSKSSFTTVTTERKIPKEKTPTILIAVNPEDAIRFVVKGSTVKCSVNVKKTDYTGLFVTTDIIGTAKTNIHKADIKLQHYFNNKMNFLYHHGMMKLEKVYRETVLNDCKLNREILKTKLAIALTNPDAITPLLLEPGMLARVMGEVLYTYKCIKVDVTIREDRGRCTNELPVILDGKPAYVNPITRIINKAITGVKTINCSNYMAPMYEIQPGSWITLPGRQMALPPHHMELIKLLHNEDFKPLDSISSNGVYSVEDIEAARRFVLFPEKREKIITEMVYTLNGGVPGATNFELILSQEHFARATHNTMKKIWGKFLIFGQMFAGMMGIYCIIVCIKIVLSQVLSTYHIYKIGGVTWKLILGCFPFLAKYLLFRHQYDIIKTMRREQDDREEDTCRINPTDFTDRVFHGKFQRLDSNRGSPPYFEIRKHSIAPEHPLALSIHIPPKNMKILLL